MLQQSIIINQNFPARSVEYINKFDSINPVSRLNTRGSDFKTYNEQY